MGGWLGDSPYECPECDGGKSTTCHCCGSTIDCEYCDSSGWDPEQVDIRSFIKAENALTLKMKEAKCVALTYEWIESNNVRRGRSGGEHGSVDVEDFLWKKN